MLYNNVHKLKRRVWIGLFTAIAAVIATVAWNRMRPVAPIHLISQNQPFVQLAGASTTTSDQLLREKAELMDPTPLFFPTEWNYGQHSLRENSLIQPEQVFGRIEPIYLVGEQTIKSYGIEEALVPEKLSDVLEQGNEAPFAGIGQIDRTQSTLSIRSGYLQVNEYGSRDTVFKQSLSGLIPPRLDFAPVEFLVIVSSAGLITDPIVTSGSGWDDVDNFLRDYLVTAYRLGARLPPGRFRVLVGM